MTDVRTRPAPATGAAPVHPRVRARRVEVARDVGRRRRRRLNVLLTLVAVAVWALVGLRSGLLDVDRVQVSGTEQTPVAEVRAALGAGRGTPMIDVDPGPAEARLEALPWVATARVQRLWPGTVRVVLTERTAVAAAPHPQGWAELDAAGRILAVGPEQPPALPTLATTHPGAPGTAVGGPDRGLLRTLGDLPTATRDLVAAVRRGSDGIVLDLAEGACVVLGDGSELDAKVAAADAVLGSVEVGPRARIDVRVPTAPALTPRGTCA